MPTILTTLNPAVRIEPARPATDVPLLARLGAATFTQTFGPLFPPEALRQHLACTFSEAVLAESLRQPENDFLLAYTATGEAAGYLKLTHGCATAFAAAQPQAQLQKIYVEQRFLPLGVGSPLLTQGLARARAAGCRLVWLEVWTGNERAIRFYQRHGFRPIAQQELTVGGLLFPFHIMAVEL